LPTTSPPVFFSPLLWKTPLSSISILLVILSSIYFSKTDKIVSFKFFIVCKIFVFTIFFFFSSLTMLGRAYFIAEIVVIAGLVVVETRVYRKTSLPKSPAS
jgi:uncharacterized membrane protein YiaA